MAPEETPSAPSTPPDRRPLDVPVLGSRMMVCSEASSCVERTSPSMKRVVDEVPLRTIWRRDLLFVECVRRTGRHTNCRRDDS